MLVLMLVLGLVAHFLKDFARIRKETGRNPSIMRYWRDNPHQSLLSVVSAVAGFIVLLETKELTSVTAFMLGYMANSVADILGKRTPFKGA